MIPRRSFLESTGQQWKLNVALGTLAWGAVAGAVQFFGPRELAVPASGAVLALGTIGLVLLVRIRCPRCRKSLGFWAMRTQSFGKWQDALHTTEACPSCGYVPDSAPPATGGSELHGSRDMDPGR